MLSAVAASFRIGRLEGMGVIPVIAEPCLNFEGKSKCKQLKSIKRHTGANYAKHRLHSGLNATVRIG